MFTFKSSDQKEVRRFRIAQFNGRTATVRSAGSAVTGHVRSIVENKSSAPAAWTITIIPEEPKPTARVAARASRRLTWKISAERRNARSGASAVSLIGKKRTRGPARTTAQGRFDI